MAELTDQPMDDFERFATRRLVARNAPPMHVLRELRRSELVDAEPLPDRARERDGR